MKAENNQGRRGDVIFERVFTAYGKASVLAPGTAAGAGAGKRLAKDLARHWTEQDGDYKTRL